MLPARIRYWLFDTLSVQPMRYVSAVRTRDARGLTRQVYDMIREDFFRNGSLTSRSKVPELMAAIWTAGREAMLVPDKVDRTTKDAISAVLSQANDCPYCEDMLISLVHAGGDHEAAGAIFAGSELGTDDDLLRRRLNWVTAIATGQEPPPPAPFSEEQLPEAIGTLMAMSDINRYSHVVMADSPVTAPFGLKSIKAFALRMFGSELAVTRRSQLEPGRALRFLPEAKLPADMWWARSNTRVADALARYVAAVDREGSKAIDSKTQRVIRASLSAWQGETMPLHGRWIDDEIKALSGGAQTIARFAIVLAKASYRITDRMVAEVMDQCESEEQFIRVLAWSSCAASRRFAEIVARRVTHSSNQVSAIAA